MFKTLFCMFYKFVPIHLIGLVNLFFVNSKHCSNKKIDWTTILNKFHVSSNGILQLLNMIIPYPYLVITYKPKAVEDIKILYLISQIIHLLIWLLVNVIVIMYFHLYSTCHHLVSSSSTMCHHLLEFWLVNLLNGQCDCESKFQSKCRSTCMPHGIIWITYLVYVSNVDQLWLATCHCIIGLKVHLL
jgi:uncharacterized protein with PQ loop repeat